MNRVSPELEARMIALIESMTSPHELRGYHHYDEARAIKAGIAAEQAALARQESPPMTAARLNALADRVEAATGPGREIDAEIAECAGLRVVDEGHPLGMQCYDSEHRSVRLPAYTRSIDDAMGLVPEGWRKDVFDADNGDCICRSDDDDETEVWARAKTWPLAITACALRARARAMEGE